MQDTDASAGGLRRLVSCFRRDQGIAFGVAFALLVLTDVPREMAVNLGAGPKVAGFGMYALFATIYAATLLAVARDRAFRMRPLADWRALGTVLPVLMAFASALWSDAPDVTLRRALGLAGSTGVGLYLAAHFELRNQLRIVGIALLLAAVGSTAIAICAPGLGVMSGVHEGAWRGLYVHKNELGRVMALAVPTSLLLAWIDTCRRASWCAALVLASGVLVASGSRAAWLVAGTCAALVGLAFLYDRLPAASRPRARSCAAALGVAGLVVASLACDSLLEVLGRDATLSGRTEIWKSLIEAGRSQRWLGAGFGAFWDPPGTRVAGIATAHSGFVQLYLDLGLVGVLVVLVPLGIYWSVALIRCLRDSTLAAWWSALYLTYFPLSNLAETSLLRHNSMSWAIYVSVIAILFGSRRR